MGQRAQAIRTFEGVFGDIDNHGGPVLPSQGIKADAK